MFRFFVIIFTVNLLIACNTQPNNSTVATHNNKAIIEEYFKYFNNHNWQQMAAMYIAQPEMKDPAYGIENVKMTQADIIKKYSELNQMIPDVKDSVIHMYESGDNVIVEFQSSGTAPDGTKFTLPICTVFEIKNGKITKDLTYYDNFEEPKK